jgi:mannosyltransferase OCH1-like enzyme
VHTDADNLSFISSQYPEYLELYTGFKYNIQRVDLVRYMYMDHYGGVYADLDLECIKSVDALLEQHNQILTLEPSTNFLNNPKLIANYFLAFEPGSLFMKKVLNDILINRYPYVGDNTIIEVLETTGPVLLTNVYNDSVKQGFSIPEPLSSLLFSPILHQDLLRRRLSAEPPFTLSDLPDCTLGVHHFIGSWL